MNEWWWVVILTEIHIKMYTQSTDQASGCAKLLFFMLVLGSFKFRTAILLWKSMWEESKMDLAYLKM
jgi:hypothetical protein